MPVSEEPHTGTRRQRVPALAPEERRAALIAATIPLLSVHGLNVSTRQIADAAGVAEGTIFGVFKDKASLVDAAVAAAFEPTPVIQALRAIDRGADLRTRLIAAAGILRERLCDQGPLLHVLRALAMQAPRIARVDLVASRQLIVHELSTLIEPDAAHLRRSPATIARLFFALVMQPRDGFLDIEHLDGTEVVSLLLDGLLIRATPTPGETPC